MVNRMNKKQYIAPRVKSILFDSKPIAQIYAGSPQEVEMDQHENESIENIDEAI